MKYFLAYLGSSVKTTNINTKFWQNPFEVQNSKKSYRAIKVMKNQVKYNNNNNNNFVFEKILLTTMLTIKILFTINSLEKRKNYSFKTLFTIPVDLKSA